MAFNRTHWFCIPMMFHIKFYFILHEVLIKRSSFSLPWVTHLLKNLIFKKDWRYTCGTIEFGFGFGIGIGISISNDEMNS